MRNSEDGLAGSLFRHVAEIEQLRLVLDEVDRDYCICLALVCTAFRDAVWARFPRPGPPRSPHTAGDAAVANAAAEYGAEHRHNVEDEGAPRSRLRTRREAMHTRAALLEWICSGASCGLRATAHSSSAARSAGTIAHGWCDVMSRHSLAHAVRVGDTDAVRFVYAQGLDAHALRGPELCALAAGRGLLPILELCRAHGEGWDSTSVRAACAGGHLEVLRWTLDHGCARDNLACHTAAAHGHVDIIRFLRARGFPWFARTAAEAARNGHLHVLEHLAAEGCPMDGRVCSWAAANGHVDVLRWARDRSLPWDEYACTMATRNGRLDSLQFLHAGGCPWSSDACLAASGLETPAVLAWLRSHGCPWMPQDCLELARELAQARRCPSQVARWIEAVLGLPPAEGSHGDEAMPTEDQVP